MSEYTPKYSPEITVLYTIVEPGQPGGRNQPELASVVEIDSVQGNGVDFSDYIQNELLNAHESDWVKEILAQGIEVA